MVQLVPAADGSNQLGRDGLSYTPPPGFSGLEVFSYTVSDQYGNEDSVEVRALVGASMYFYFTEDPPKTVVEGDEVRINIGTIGYELDTDSVELLLVGLVEDDGTPLSL